jgi:hypothetical protein
MGQRVFGAARIHGEFIVVPGAGHNDVDRIAGERYWAWLARALGRRLDDETIK